MLFRSYNAIRLTQTHEVASLILIVPGIYTPSAYTLPFGPQFSSAIRRERSWEDSDAWDMLAQYRGRLLVVPETEHRHLFSPLLERPQEFDEAMALIAHCLRLRIR